MTDAELAALRALANAVPPGKLTTRDGAPHLIVRGPYIVASVSSDNPAPDVAYIIAACNAVPALLAEVKRLRTELASYQRNAAYVAGVIENEGVYRP